VIELTNRSDAMEQHRPISPRPTDPDPIARLRGTFSDSDGYTADDINRIFGVIEDVTGHRLICRWSLFCEGWYQGLSEFYFKDGPTYYYDVGVYQWLNGDEDAPLNLGDPLQWRGAPVPDADLEGPQHAVTDDGLHNCALVDKDR
jgi:hypothetical protein